MLNVQLSTHPSTMATISTLPIAAHHNREFAMQKYLLLHDQHEYIRQHIETLRPLGSPYMLKRSSTTPSSPSSSPTSSPTRAVPQPHSSIPPSHAPPRSLFVDRSQLRRPSLPTPSRNVANTPALDTVFESTVTELEVEEARLFDVNEAIKRALTELLNCEAVRADHDLRTWIQCRLMDTEKELRSGRRRRSNPDHDLEDVLDTEVLGVKKRWSICK